MAASLMNGNKVAFHLSDRAFTPVISSSNSPTQSQQLTTTAITTYECACRLGLGIPQRIMVETTSSGPVLLHSFLSPGSRQQPHPPHVESHNNGGEIIKQAREDLRSLGSSSDQENGNGPSQHGAALVNGFEDGPREDEEERQAENTRQLIVTVIAPSAAVSGEARRTASRLERMGRELQREWLRGQDALRQTVGEAEREDG